jgi:LysR family transcriptional regulator, glycine cleavage system transcriptional activator
MDLSKLPNLNALRAFEAAARLESFSQAAQELFVTHGAISHRIRALEDALGVALFVRDGKRVRLTECGRTYAGQVRLAMLDIAQATQAVRAGERERRLIVSVLPSFAARWLMPRLGRFIERHPEVDFELKTATTLVDFRRDEVDVAIRFGTGDYPGLHAEPLMAETYFPACAPDYKHGKLPRRPADLLKAQLLRSDRELWHDWFVLAGMPDAPEPRRGVMYEDSSMLLQAALDGGGIGLVRRSLAQDDVASARLIKLFEIEAPSVWRYFLVCLPGTAQSPRVALLRAWLREEVARFEHSHAGARA